MVGLQFIIFVEVVDGVLDVAITSDGGLLYFEEVGFLGGNELHQAVAVGLVGGVAEGALGSEVKHLLGVADGEPAAKGRVKTAFNDDPVDRVLSMRKDGQHRQQQYYTWVHYIYIVMI